MKKALILTVFLIMALPAISQIPCIVPGNPGTVDLPAPCPYAIVPGIEFTTNLPPGSTLQLTGFLDGFACTHPVCPFPGICEIPGGILGGTMVCYSCNLNLTVMGTGVFAGYMRTLVIPGIMSYHTAPRTTGLPVQEFQCEMMMLLFEVVGDPDFSLLRIASGLEMQLPGSGTTALTKMPDGQWWVESFFDVFTEVTINGNPQGPLGNVAGSGVYPSRLWQGIPAPKGACCLQVSKSCITTSQVDCFYRNGVYYGDNSSCDTVNCGPLTDSFQIVMNPQGSPLIAGGSGQYEDTNYNIGGWYLYPNTGWWNIWYYDHPLDTSRFKRIDISFYVAPMDPNLPGWIEVAANWSTPLWSLQGDTSVSRRPPVPGIPGMNETLHIGRHTLFAFQGFIQPGFQQLCFYVENYNPEWVSVDVRGENFQLEQGQIVHECIHGQLPPIGRCCYLDNNNVWQCADNFECECSALNGSWNDTLNCTANPCPVPVDSGACCLPNKQCVNASQTSCLAAGGVFKGVGSSCDTVNCGPITNTFYITRGNNPQPGIPPLNAGGTGQFDNGAGFNGWYWYETYDWWNIWYYDHPYDTSRWKMVTISFDVWVFNPQFPFDLDFALNWSMPAWSLQGITTPPLPPIPPSMEDMIIGRHIFPTVNLDPTIGMQHFDLCYIFPDFNPEWVSVDVRGYNFEILNGVITHECIFDTLPHKGRCCYPDATGMIQCADIYQCECAMLGGTWDVSLNCTANPCPQPQGACCMPDGSCVQTDINTCGQILHGMWMGAGVPCVPNPCPQPEPDSGACCYPDGSCMYRDSISCIQTGGAYQGDGVSCMPNPCPQPQGACCMPDGSCVQTDINTCGQILHGMWMGAGVPCVPNPCPQPEPDSGACCYPDGSCMYRDSISCIQTGGTYQGDGVSCMPNPCPQPQGACCMPDGSCVQTDINTCGQILHGMWMGVGIPCVPNPCPQPQGACCMPDGSCVQTDINTCGQVLHGMWMGAGVPCVPNPCPQPEPDSGACCYPDGSCMYRDSISCIQTGGTYQGDGVSCTPNPCPQPQGACCMPDGSCVQTDINTCGQILHGMWMGAGVPCVPNPCPQPEPDSGACCYPDGSCMYRDSISCIQTGGTYQGDGVSCMPNPCPQPQGACCMPDGSCVQTDINTCGQILHGMWMGVGIPCVPNPCPQPQGACCMPDGSCVQTDINTCGQILHGMWMGVGVPCVPNPCPQPEPDSGACCYPDGSCMFRDSISCIQTGGTYQGDGVSCMPNPCPQPQGACCMPDGSCVQTDINTCGQILHGMWMGAGVPCVPNPCPQPEPDSGACCYPDGSCMYRDSISCIQTGGTYQGDGVSCMPNPCPQPQGACCMPDGSCVQTDINTCGQILHGMWMGVGIPCVPNPCPQPQGACCMPDGSCVQTDINTCGQILHGMWMGVGIPCVPNPCTAMPDTIIGVVIYGNTARTPMRGVSVILSKGVLNIDTAVTDTSGVFRFLAWPGSYHLKAFYHGTWPHGAANANDALLVMKHFVGLDTVYGIHWLAGDVNASHNLSTTDAMQIAQRFVGMIPSFAAGDWAFLEYDITVGGSPKSSTSVTMEGLVYGDANASYTFGMKKETGPGLVKDNPLQVKPMESVMIPVRVSQAASIASASLSIRYASHSFDIVTVNSESNQGSLVFKTSDGILRIAWYDIEESNLEQGDVLFWITATVKPLRLRSLTELYWEILPESELTGFNGKALDVDLMIPDLQLMPSGLTVGQNKPNPFTKMTDIDFFISEPGMVHFEVMNPLGQQIAVLAHGQMEAGRHEVSFDCRNCPPGVYFYRVLFTGTTEREVITRRMILQ